MRDETILRRARFDSRLPTYWTLSAVVIGLFTCVGFLWVPFQLLINRRRFDSLECELTDRSLHYRAGFLFRVEKTIPLDKIQDLSLHEGPLLRHLGLCALRVETAGQGPQGTGTTSLVGLVEAREFRDAVLSQRDEVTSRAPDAPEPREPREDVLTEIRDGVRAIERHLRESR